eukprot:ANDGO_03789.mRNA.1 hypothetical protein
MAAEDHELLENYVGILKKLVDRVSTQKDDRERASYWSQIYTFKKYAKQMLLGTAQYIFALYELLVVKNRERSLAYCSKGLLILDQCPSSGMIRFALENVEKELASAVHTPSRTKSANEASTKLASETLLPPLIPKNLLGSSTPRTALKDKGDKEPTTTPRSSMPIAPNSSIKVNRMTRSLSSSAVSSYAAAAAAVAAKKSLQSKTSKGRPCSSDEVTPKSSRSSKKSVAFEDPNPSTPAKHSNLHDALENFASEIDSLIASSEEGSPIRSPLSHASISPISDQGDADGFRFLPEADPEPRDASQLHSARKPSSLSISRAAAASSTPASSASSSTGSLSSSPSNSKKSPSRSGSLVDVSQPQRPPSGSGSRSGSRRPSQSSSVQLPVSQEPVTVIAETDRTNEMDRSLPPPVPPPVEPQQKKGFWFRLRSMIKGKPKDASSDDSAA